VLLTYIILNNLYIKSDCFSYEGWTISGEMEVDLNGGVYILYQTAYAPPSDEDSPPGTTEIIDIIGIVGDGGSLVINNLDIRGPDDLYIGLNKLYVHGHGMAQIVFVDRQLKFGGVDLIGSVEVTGFEVSTSTKGFEIPHAKVYFYAAGYVYFIDANQVEIHGVGKVLVEELTLEFSTTNADATMIINSLYVAIDCSIYFNKSSLNLIASAEGQLTCDRFEFISGSGSSLVVNDINLLTGDVVVLIYDVTGGGTVSSSGGITTLGDDDPNVYTTKEMFVSLHCSAIGWSQIILTGPGGKTISLPELSVVDISLEFTVSGKVSIETGEVLIDLHFNSGKSQSITVNGIGAFIIECIDSWFFDNWDISGLSFEMSSGMLDIYLKASSSSSSIEFNVQSTCHTTITLLDAGHNSGIVSHITIASLVINEGSLSCVYHHYNEGKGDIKITTSETANPTLELLEVTIGGYKFSRNGITVTSPGFEASWDIDGDRNGHIYANGGIEWSGYENWGLHKFSSSLVANDFFISWNLNNSNTEEPFDILDWGGSLDGDIYILVAGAFVLLWPLLNTNNRPVAVAGGPYETANVPGTITFDFSGCYDPDDDQITEMNINYGFGLLDWTGWIQFDEHPQYTYSTAGDKTLQLKVRDEYGWESIIDTATVIIGTNTFKVSGQVTDESGSPLTDGNDNALVEVVGESKSGQVNSQGYYVLPDLEKNKNYVLRCTADGYFTEEFDISAEDAVSDMVVNFVLIAGYMQVEILIREEVVDDYSNKVYENDVFTVHVIDESNSGNVYNAQVTYEYKYYGFWYQVDYSDFDIDDYNPKATNYYGKTSFTAVEVDNYLDYVVCRVTVIHDNYQTIISDNFKVYEGNSGVPYFLDTNPTYIISSEVATKIQSINAYDPDNDVLSFSVNGYSMSYSKSIIINDLHAKIEGQQYDSDTLRIYVGGKSDTDTVDNEYYLTILVTDGTGSDSWSLHIIVNDVGTCLLAGSKISMDDDTYKNIEDIKVGDLVRSYNESNGVFSPSMVTKTTSHKPDEMTNYYVVINNCLRITPNHRIFVNGDWVQSGNVKIGDVLLDGSGKATLVYSIEKIYEKVPTYNFEVDTTHSYFADGILVHNGDQK